MNIFSAKIPNRNIMQLQIALTFSFALNTHLKCLLEHVQRNTETLSANVSGQEPSQSFAMLPYAVAALQFGWVKCVLISPLSEGYIVMLSFAFNC